jgi:hypothetical protein
MLPVAELKWHQQQSALQQANQSRTYRVSIRPIHPQRASFSCIVQKFILKKISFYSEREWI